MALTIAVSKYLSDGKIVKVTYDSSYPGPGGYTFGNTQLGTKIITYIEALGPAISSAAALALLQGWDPVTTKLRLFQTAATVSNPFPEIANATNVALYIGYFRVYGM